MQKDGQNRLAYLGFQNHLLSHYEETKYTFGRVFIQIRKNGKFFKYFFSKITAKTEWGYPLEFPTIPSLRAILRKGEIFMNHPIFL
jgi:hypothetical protein